MPSTCDICGLPAHGYHFGAITCRACAAFFKRALLAKRFRKCCKFEDECTDFSGIDSPSCKSCRMKKCLKMGMNSENMQSLQTVKTMKLIVSLPPSINFSTVKSKQRNFVDVNFLITKAFEILRCGSPMPLNPSLTQLEKISFGKLKSPGTCRRLDYVGRNNVMKTWECDFLAAAKWLTHFDEFMKLHPGMQMQLLQTIWHVWARIYKVIRTAEVWKEKTSECKILQVCDDFYIEFDNIIVDVSWMSKCSFEEIRCLLYGKEWEDEFYRGIETVSKLNLTETELTYMLAQLSFQYAANRYPGTPISEVCEQFQEVLANDIHKYYTSDEFRDKNYAGRLAQMLKVNQETQRSIRKLRDKTLIAQTFDIFILDFSHPEMFVDTGCCA
ncbi:unnamed protein product [Caenorhabditis brenneri]